MRAIKKNKNLIKKTLTRLDCIYLAGFIDADGGIYATIVRDDSHEFKFAIRVEVTITQHKKSRWWLNQVKKKIPGANICYALEISCGETKTVDRLTVNSLPRVREFLKKLAPHLRLKQKQANRAIEIINRYYKKKTTSKEFVQLCKIVDSISVLNYSKSRKTTSAVVTRELKELGFALKDSPNTDSGFDKEIC